MAWSPDLIDSRLQAVIDDKGFSSNYLKKAPYLKLSLLSLNHEIMARKSNFLFKKSVCSLFSYFKCLLNLAI